MQQQTVVITGAAAGVGRATALAFARRGARIGLISRDRQALEAVREAVRSEGGDALCLALDVADAEAVDAAADQVEAAFGPIDIWINSAMATVFSPATRITAEEFRRVTEVTYLGAVHGTLAALRRMLPRDRGTILQVGSALAYVAIPLQGAYCGAKFALRGFTDSVRTELLHDGSRVRLVMVQLPAVNTPQFDWARTHMARQPRPVGTVFEPDAIAEQILYAARHPRREYWLGASTLKAILGSWAAPSVADRYLAHGAYEAQERPEPVQEGRQDNLFAPVTELHRTRGAFSAEARGSVLRVSGTTGRVLALAAGALVTAGLGALLGAAIASRPSPVSRRG